MVRNKLIPIITVAALGLAGVLGVFGYQAVYAQTATPTATATAQATQAAQAAQATPSGQPGMRGGPWNQNDEQYLATALGVTTDKLTAAYQAANTEALKQAVAKGLITQAQADQYAANAQNGRPFRFGQAASSGIDYNALLAQALGITTDQLTAAQTKAFNTALDDAVKNGTLTQAQADLEKGRRALQNDSAFQASMKSAYETALKQAVTDGVITQAQADQLLQAETQKTNGSFDGFGPGFGFGRGGHGGPGGMMHGDNGANNANGASTTPSTPQATPTTGGNGL